VKRPRHPVTQMISSRQAVNRPPPNGRRRQPPAAGTVDDHRQLDVRRLGRLSPGRSFDVVWSQGAVRTGAIRVRVEPHQLVLSYRHRRDGDAWTEHSYPVRLTRTPCHFGGLRAWFLCPALGCGRRVAILYGGTYFACRHCHGLVYPSTRENAAGRAMRRAIALRERLGWPLSVMRPTGGRPKWMRRKTFRRLLWQHEDAREGALAPIRKALGWDS
jgi:hypothetical protein